MTTATKQDTAQIEMRANTRAQLDILLSDLGKAQDYVNNGYANRNTINEQLQATQGRRAELLSELRQAQASAMKAEAARDLAIDTPVEAERANQLEQAKAKVTAVHAAVNALAETDEANRALMAKNDAELEQAVETLTRIQERVAIAQSLYDEVDGLHRDEIKAQALARLQAARAHRFAVKRQLAKAEDACNQAQQELAAALADWPEHQRATLAEFAEFEPDDILAALNEKMHMIDTLEYAAGLVSDKFLLRQLGLEVPIDSFYTFGHGPRTRKQMQTPAGRAANDYRGLPPELWQYHLSCNALVEARDKYAANHRQACIIKAMVESKHTAR